MRAKGDYRLPHLHNRASGTFARPQTSLAWNHIWVPLFGLRASLHMPPPSHPLPLDPCILGCLDKPARPDAPRGWAVVAGTLAVPLESVKERKRERDVRAPPKEQPDFASGSGGHRRRPLTAQGRGGSSSRTARKPPLPQCHGETTRPEMRRFARRRNEPAQGACAAIVARRPRGMVGRRGRTQTTTPTMPRGN